MIARLATSARLLSTAAAKPRLPYEGVRVIEKANLLSGRLAGLLFADQGAEVLVVDPSDGEDVDSYLNRSKIAIKATDVTPSSADIIIVDGQDGSIPRLPHQIETWQRSRSRPHRKQHRPPKLGHGSQVLCMLAQPSGRRD